MKLYRRTTIAVLTLLMSALVANANAASISNDDANRAMNNPAWTPIAVLEGPVAMIGGTVATAVIPTVGGLWCAATTLFEERGKSGKCLRTVAHATGKSILLIGSGAADTVTVGYFSLSRKVLGN